MTRSIFTESDIRVLEEKYYSPIIESDPHLKFVVECLLLGAVPPADMDEIDAEGAD